MEQGSPIIEREAMEAFLKALPLNLKREVLRTRTKNLEAAWEKAKRHHQLMKTLPPAPIIAAATEQSAPSRLDQLESTIAALQRHLLNDNTGKRRRTPEQRRNKNELRCWNCGKIGHLQRECHRTRNSTNRFRPLNSNGSRP
ncbi:Gag-Pol polyprotein [Chionoecetes opilio]|uniref:Gag-Pol polyprotein n=1 Tax=Chionoecetes opilio TaxID=41210 RepID=A0A8J5D5E1_CHIOP|nr:Gag-Pol polyprotein [Chionoecetes opilio]